MFLSNDLKNMRYKQTSFKTLAFHFTIDSCYNISLRKIFALNWLYFLLILALKIEENFQNDVHVCYWNSKTKTV